MSLTPLPSPDNQKGNTQKNHHGYNQLTKLHSFTGFTLVELIVVITILAILGTIAFLSLQGYSSSARDSVRISNLSNLHKGLSLFHVVSGIYPMPEGQITISASGTDIGYQGYAKDMVGSIAKLSLGIGQDPLDSSIYTTYSVNTSKTRMQLMSFLEDGGSVSAFVPDDLNNLFTSTSFASSTSDYTLRTPLSKGDSLGILLSSATGTLNQPVQENYSVSSFTGVDVVNTSSGYIAYIRQNKIINGTGNILKILTANNPRNPIAYANSCKDINDNGFSIGDGVYYINPTNTSTGSFQVYCDMITDGGGWTLTSWNKGISNAVPPDFFISVINKNSVANKNMQNMAASINPEDFSMKANTTSAMLKSAAYSAAPIIENNFGTWNYNTTKCTGALMHTSRTEGCTQVANDNWNSADRFNIAIGNDGIVPYYLSAGRELCFSLKGWCDFEFYLR